MMKLADSVKNGSHSFMKMWHSSINMNKALLLMNPPLSNMSPAQFLWRIHVL